MSLAYSKCRITFIPTDTQRPTREYSDRSLIEVRHDANEDYILRGLDIQNNKAEIFKFLLIPDGLYKFASSTNDCDEIRWQDGTYRLWLDSGTRDTFHIELRKILDELAILNKNSPDINSKTSQSNKLLKIPTNIDDQDNILILIQQLGEYIKDGRVDKAEPLARKLALKNVQLMPKTLDRDLNDEKVGIRVKIDGIDLPTNDTDKPCDLNVYRSTTIRELRAIFEHACGFPSASQYFFVNGHLAYVDSTMDDLKVDKNPLFVLFLIENYSTYMTKF